jgi:hypothetical protein
MDISWWQHLIYKNQHIRNFSFILGTTTIGDRDECTLWCTQFEGQLEIYI